jgi:hypothetical protein
VDGRLFIEETSLIALETKGLVPILNIEDIILRVSLHI